MAENFYTILTNIGMAAFANAQVSEGKVDFASIAVGDSNGSYYNPVATATKLVNEVWRGSINAISIDEANPNWIIVEAVIPATIGGFSVREIGVFDTSGALLAIGKIPETYKPAAEQGSLKDLYLRIILEVSNASSVTLKVDPAVIYASKKYVDDKVTVVVSGLENVQQQLNQKTAAIDTKLDTHIKDDSGHVRFIGNATGGDGMACRTDLAPVDLVGGKLVPRKGHAFRFFKVDNANTGPATLVIVSDTLPGNPSSVTYQIVNSKGLTLKGGEMVKGGIYTLVFNGTSFQLQGEGGGYGTSDLIKAQDLINRDYIQTNINDKARALYFNFESTQIATVDGVEYAYTYYGQPRDSWLFCWEVLTGKLVWQRYINYQFAGRIIIDGTTLYIGYRDLDGVVGGGGGIELLTAKGGAPITRTKIVSANYTDNVIDICTYTYIGQRYILAFASTGSIYQIAHFAMDGKFVTISPSNMGSNFSEGIPLWIQTVGETIFLASLATVYHFTPGWIYLGKLTTIGSNTIGGMAPNNMGGISVLKNNALLYHYTTSLVETGSLLTTGAAYGTGFGIKGDLFALMNTNVLMLYRMNAGGGSATQVARLDYKTDYQTSAPVKCLGFSENAFVSPISNLPINPPVFSRTLKVQR